MSETRMQVWLHHTAWSGGVELRRGFHIYPVVQHMQHNLSHGLRHRQGPPSSSTDSVGLGGGCLELTASTPVVCTSKMSATGNVLLRKQASWVCRYWRMLKLRMTPSIATTFAFPWHASLPISVKERVLILNLRASSVSHTRTWGFYFVT